MKKLILVVLFISVFASCKKELEPQSTSIVAPAPAPQSNNVPVTPVATPAPQAAQASQNNNSVQVMPQPVVQPQKVAKGMNPPHGQPNHRCDIAVGQPLSLPIAKTKAVTVPPPASGSASIIPVKMENAPAAAQSAETQVPQQTEKSTTTESK